MQLTEVQKHIVESALLAYTLSEKLSETGFYSGLKRNAFGIFRIVLDVTFGVGCSEFVKDYLDSQEVCNVKSLTNQIEKFLAS